jgi:hypothetical protein
MLVLVGYQQLWWSVAWLAIVAGDCLLRSLLGWSGCLERIGRLRRSDWTLLRRGSLVDRGAPSWLIGLEGIVVRLRRSELVDGLVVKLVGGNGFVLLLVLSLIGWSIVFSCCDFSLACLCHGFFEILLRFFDRSQEVYIDR